jgi:ComF family protein
MLRDLGLGLLDLLAPLHCAACELELGPRDRHFCAGCWPLIEAAPNAWRPPAVDAALFRYEGPLADAIRRFKYAGRIELASSFGAMMVDAAPRYLGHVDAIVPMPLHRRKLRTRGFNPAALIAQPLARALRVPLRVAWLVRHRHTHSQAGLSSRERAENVRAAFEARAVPPRRVLLVDDVRTTGATLHEAAICLRANGHSVATLALAWAPLLEV